MPFQRNDAYKVAKDLAIAVVAAKIRDAELRDQASRSSKSAFLQTAEGLPNDSVPMRRKYFICARNSACETAAALDLGALAPTTSFARPTRAPDASPPRLRLAEEPTTR